MSCTAPHANCPKLFLFGHTLFPSCGWHHARACGSLEQEDVQYRREPFGTFLEMLASDSKDVYMTVQTEELYSPIMAAIGKGVFEGPRSFTRFLSGQARTPL